MKILFISECGEALFKFSEFLPRIGDKVDIFYRPYPTVTSVLLYPSP
jgi:hypothetical protein